MLRLMSDIVPALIACADGQLKNFDLRWFDDVGADGDHGDARVIPATTARAFVIEGLDDAAKIEGVEIFHAGTKSGAARSSPMAVAC